MCVTFRCEISEIKQFKVHVITTIMNQTHYVRIIVSFRKILTIIELNSYIHRKNPVDVWHLHRSG